MTERLTNPSNRNYSWKGGVLSQGKKLTFAERVVYYDKEKQENVFAKPFEFAVLGISFYITGLNTERQGKKCSIFELFLNRS